MLEVKLQQNCDSITKCGMKFIGLLGCKIYEENGHCVNLLLRILGQEKGTMNWNKQGN